MSDATSATIADGARFNGTYKGRDLTVLGVFDGGVELSGRLRLGPQGRVKGKVKAGAVEIDGEFEGEVRAEALAFGATARARGVFLAPRLSIREGAQVDGTLNVDPAKVAAAAGNDGKNAGSDGKNKGNKNGGARPNAGGGAPANAGGAAAPPPAAPVPASPSAAPAPAAPASEAAAAGSSSGAASGEPGGNSGGSSSQPSAGANA